MIIIITTDITLNKTLMAVIGTLTQSSYYQWLVTSVTLQGNCNSWSLHLSLMGDLGDIEGK